MKLLITGATGFIGTAIISDLQKGNHDISILTRNKNNITNHSLNIYENIDEISNEIIFDAIINLAGAPISKKWSKSYKRTLVESRISTTKNIYNLAKRLKNTPKMLISASAIGYYGSQGNNIVDENSPPKSGFTHTLCDLWEQEALKLENLGVNVAIIRLGVVLGRNAGMLKETAPVFKMFLGGPIGDGNQYLSWVHIVDVVKAINFLLLKPNKSHIYNLTAPFPVTNKTWTTALAKALNRPAFLPLPSIIVKFIFGEMGESLLLQGQKVLPTNLSHAGFKFKYPTIDNALSDIFSQTIK